MIAVRDIAPEDLWDIFDLRREIGPSHHWFLTPMEVRDMSSHLGKSYLSIMTRCALYMKDSLAELSQKRSSQNGIRCSVVLNKTR
jgi:hypothetical protein